MFCYYNKYFSYKIQYILNTLIKTGLKMKSQIIISKPKSKSV